KKILKAQIEYTGLAVCQAVLGEQRRFPKSHNPLLANLSKKKKCFGIKEGARLYALRIERFTQVYLTPSVWDIWIMPAAFRPYRLRFCFRLVLSGKNEFVAQCFFYAARRLSGRWI